MDNINQGLKLWEQWKELNEKQKEFMVGYLLGRMAGHAALGTKEEKMYGEAGFKEFNLSMEETKKRNLS